MIDPALDLPVPGGTAGADRRRGDRRPAAIGTGVLAVLAVNVVLAVVVLAAA